MSGEDEKLPLPPKLPGVRVKKGARIRIVTRAPPGMRPRGQDTLVTVVQADGTEEALENVKAASWRVDARQTFCVLTLVGVDVEIEGELDDALAQARTEAEHWKREAAEATQLATDLQERLEKSRYSQPGE